jgi:hypothetical protein
MTGLKFSKANAKIEALKKVPELSTWLEGKRKIYSLDLLSGFSCPFADKCLSKASLQSDGRRKIKDGPNTEFRCFSASQEVQYTALYEKRKHNFHTLRDLKRPRLMFNELSRSLPADTGILRFHVGGDFFNRSYFEAAIMLANENPDILFYAYTKSLNWWVEKLNVIPDNLVLTASRGGVHDDLIDRYGLRESVVVYSEEKAEELGLDIDHDDSHACVPEWRNNSFALLIHGQQPAKSEASVALQLLKKKNVKHTYSRKSVI